jgi:hypothetical protein
MTRMKAVINAARLHEFIVCAVLDDFADVDNERLAGRANPARAVGDYKTGMHFHEMPESLLQVLLRPGVDVAGDPGTLPI